MRIDCHQHFWTLANPFTDWPTAATPTIHRDFGAAELAPSLQQADVVGTVLVQAAPSVNETLWLLAVAETCKFVRGVVGWVDFTAADALGQLDTVASNPMLRGVRPMLQGIAESGWILKSEFVPILEALGARGLCFDALVVPRQIGEIAELARRHTDLRIVLDHCGKPDIARGQFAPWANDIAQLAKHSNVYCKLSGLLTEAGEDRSDEVMAPYVHHVVDCFGAHRLIWGSDWPVINLVGAYGDWVAQCERLLADLDDQQRAAIFYHTGMSFYGLPAN